VVVQMGEWLGQLLGVNQLKIVVLQDQKLKKYINFRLWEELAGKVHLLIDLH
jgi:hypothetical protein